VDRGADATQSSSSTINRASLRRSLEGVWNLLILLPAGAEFGNQSRAIFRSFMRGGHSFFLWRLVGQLIEEAERDPPAVVLRAQQREVGAFDEN